MKNVVFAKIVGFRAGGRGEGVKLLIYNIKETAKLLSSKIYILCYTITILLLFIISGYRKNNGFWLKLSEFGGRKIFRSRIKESAKLPSSMVYSILESLDRVYFLDLWESILGF